MLRKIYLAASVVCLCALSSGALAKCDPPCKQGETCRFEQPNTFYCKSYENVSGVQGANSAGGASNPAMGGYRAPDRNMSRGNDGKGKAVTAKKGTGNQQKKTLKTKKKVDQPIRP